MCKNLKILVEIDQKVDKSPYTWFLMPWKIPFLYLIFTSSFLSCVKPDPELGRADDLQSLFIHESFSGLTIDTLNTHALPLKILVTSLIFLDHSKNPSSEPRISRFKEIIKKFGFFYPSEIVNASHIKFDAFLPIGLLRKKVRSILPPVVVEVTNISCASCHAGPSYSKSGKMEDRLWLGVPNPKIDFESYTTAVYKAMKHSIKHQEGFFELLDKLYPDLGFYERFSLKSLIWPLIEDRIQALMNTIDRPTPHLNGAPALTNGVGSLKNLFRILPQDKKADEFGFTSIPSLADRMLRSSLLYDGAYSPPGREPFRNINRNEVSKLHIKELSKITSYFTIPTIGITTAEVKKHQNLVNVILSGFHKNAKYPKFPVRIENKKKNRGEKIFNNHCANCHGTYQEDSLGFTLDNFPNQFSPIEEIATDPERSKAMDLALTNKINGDPNMSEDVFASRNSGYVATILTNIWLTAPYLHNGSVPTLWHLMRPDQRPESFWVGGPEWDIDKVGLKSINGQGTLYDTREKGKSNKGHSKIFYILNEAEKEDLLEFLKAI
ncbi:MAG: hypothetical protein AB8G05_23050 [Oligoflexales bacterium]